jgi:hypothetical protein
MCILWTLFVPSSEAEPIQYYNKPSKELITQIEIRKLQIFSTSCMKLNHVPLYEKPRDLHTYQFHLLEQPALQPALRFLQGCWQTPT